MQELGKYLPIGSVVLLNNGKKRLMVTGYAQIDLEKQDVIYDYCGCIYPEGIISTSQVILFNHTDINKIYCLGYSDEEQKEYNKLLLDNLSDEKKALLINQASQKLNGSK